MADTVTYPTPRPGESPCAVTGDCCIATGGGNTDNGGDLPSLNTPPVVTITSPPNNSSFPTLSTIHFTGTAIDLEDGDISASIEWSSDLDGDIGTGASIDVVLTDGVHTITAYAVDSGGLDDSDSISVEVAVGEVIYGDMKLQVATFTVNPRKDPGYQDVLITSLGWDEPSSINNAYLKLRCTGWGMGGYTDNRQANATSKTAGIYMHLLNTSYIRVYRQQLNDVDAEVEVNVEMREYTGSPGGDWEFIVRDQGYVTMSGGVLTGTQTVASISAYGDCVPHQVGASCGKGDYAHDIGIPVFEMRTDGTGFDWERKDDWGTTTGYCGYACVEYTGSKWTVYNNLRIDDITRNGVEQGATLPGATDVGDWTECFIERQHTTDELSSNGYTRQIVVCLYPNLADTTKIKYWASVTTPRRLDLMLHIVKGTGLAVQHLQSVSDTPGDIERPGRGQGPWVDGYDLAVSIPSTKAVWLDACIATDGSTTKYPIGWWLYDMFSTTHIAFWNSSGYGISSAPLYFKWAAQIIEFPVIP